MMHNKQIVIQITQEQLNDFADAIIARYSKQVLGLANLVPAPFITIGDIHINFAGREVTISDQTIELSPLDFKLLHYLAMNAGVALSRSQLLETAWPEDAVESERSVDVAIRRLRKALGRYGEQIITMHGVGYKLQKSLPQ